MFDHIFKHLEDPQKYCAASRVFNSLLVFRSVVKHSLSCLTLYFKEQIHRVPQECTYKGVETQLKTLIKFEKFVRAVAPRVVAHVSITVSIFYENRF